MSPGPCRGGLGILLWLSLILLVSVTVPSAAQAAAAVARNPSGGHKRSSSSRAASLLPKQQPNFPSFERAMSALARASAEGSEQTLQVPVTPTRSPVTFVHSGITPRPSVPDRNPGESTTIIRLATKGSLFLQVFPNGTVRGTPKENNIFSVLERVAVSIGFVYLRAIAAGRFVCLNRCGLLYGSTNFTDECVFREGIEQNWYNTYKSKSHSSKRKSLFLALNPSGQSCRLNLNSTQTRFSSLVGADENFALFSPIRNIVLPEGESIASLYQIGHNYALHRKFKQPLDSAEQSGCAPQCRRTRARARKQNQRPRCRHRHCENGSGGRQTTEKKKRKEEAKQTNKKKKKTTRLSDSSSSNNKKERNHPRTKEEKNTSKPWPSFNAAVKVRHRTTAGRQETVFESLEQFTSPIRA